MGGIEDFGRDCRGGAALKAALYFHTVRHLRPGQIIGRLRHKLRSPRPGLQPPPPRRTLNGCWAQPCERAVSMRGLHTVVFLNEQREIVGREAWNDPSAEKLWLYNLHYFDDLNAQGADERRAWHAALIERWIDENPPCGGNGWEPYPSSLRIVNWIKYALRGNELPPSALASLAIQVRCLAERLEYHLLGNHLLANAKALVFAGLFFEGDEARKWRETGAAILRRELKEQILPDGGHFELSPMYHCIILEDLLDVANISCAFGVERIVPDSLIHKMRIWLAAMTHPDGGIAFFNDAAFGIAPDRAQLESYAIRLGYGEVAAMQEGAVYLADSGYVRLQRGRAVVVLDVAEVGPSYLPGHAHADTLSFEMSIDGRRLFVNSGTSCYGTGGERLRQRGTKAHNTLVIDGQDSSEVWGGFRVARRAHAKAVAVSERDSGICVEACHDGYRRLLGRNLHRRCWELDDEALLIRDEVTGAFGMAELRFHLHPEISSQLAGERQAILKMPGGGAVVMGMEGARLHLEVSSWHPGFGVSQTNVCVVGVLEGAKTMTRIGWGGVA